MNSQFVRIALSTLALGTIAACSARIEGGSPAPGPKTPAKPAFAHVVPGPSLNGTWKSGCVVDARHSSTWDVITITINEQNVVRHVDLYADSACAKLSRAQDEDGEFRYAKKRGENKFAVDYRFKMQGGTYEQYENYTLGSDGSLWISNEIGGDAEPYVKLVKAGGGENPTPTPAPQPAPQPNPSPAVITVGQHVAKYGDRVEIRGQVSGVDQKEIYTNQGHDERAGTWTLFFEISGTRTSMGYRHVRSVWSSRATQDMFANCAARGGSLQVITVAAGAFQTCRLDEGTRTVWYGDAPVLGIIKIESKEGSYKSELHSYTWGDAS